MKKNKLYIIEGKTYLNHINDEVHLYGLLHQLAFLAGRIKDEEDVFHVLDTAKRYGEIAEEKFQGWDIPGRYLVFGDPKDLNGLMGKELAEVEMVPAEEPAPKKYKDFLRLKKRAGNYEKEMKRIYRSLGLPEDSSAAHDVLEESIIRRHNMVLLEDDAEEPLAEGDLEGDEVWSD